MTLIDEISDSSAAGSSANSSRIRDIPKLLSRYKFETEEKMALKKTIELQKKAIELQKTISNEWQEKYHNLQLEHNKLLASFEELLHALDSNKALNSQLETEAKCELQDLTAENKNLEDFIEVLTSSGTQQATGSRDKSLEGSAFRLTDQEEIEKMLLQTRDSPQDQRQQNVQKNGPRATMTETCSDLVVLNLPYTANENDLKMYFSQYGELVMTHVKRKYDTGEPQGFAFIRFAEYRSQCTVIRLEHHRIGNRVCVVRVPNKKQRLDDQAAIQAADLSRVVYVSRCTKEMTFDLLHVYFNRFGEVSTVHVPDPFKACAFVRFTDPNVAKKLWGRDVTIMGESVGLAKAMPRSGNPRKRKAMQSSEEGLEGEFGKGGNAWVAAGGHGGGGGRSGSGGDSTAGPSASGGDSRSCTQGASLFHLAPAAMTVPRRVFQCPDVYHPPQKYWRQP